MRRICPFYELSLRFPLLIDVPSIPYMNLAFLRKLSKELTLCYR